MCPASSLWFLIFHKQQIRISTLPHLASTSPHLANSACLRNNKYSYAMEPLQMHEHVAQGGNQ